MNKTDHAVLTGDLIKSRDLSDQDMAQAFDGLAEVARRFEALQKRPACLTRARGDAWQMLTTPALAVRAMLTVRARLRMIARHVDTRIAAGIGTGDIPGTTLADATGPAFVASGHRLDAMKRGERLAMADAPALATATLPLLDWVSERWTERQAEIAWQALDLPEAGKSALAARFGVEPQSLHDVWDSAGIDPIRTACAVWEDAFRPGSSVIASSAKND